MTETWDERAEAYRTSAVHAAGLDLDLVIELCEAQPGVRALDVATGGGHVARRLREAGAEVVTVDPALAMHPDVVASAESLPFPDASFDVVVNRLAAHHFASIGEAVGEFARVTRGLVVIEDHRYTDEQTEAAEKLRDPSHGRSLSEDEWHELLAGAGLEVERVERFDMELDFESWFERTQTPVESHERVRRLLAPRTAPDGWTWTSPIVILRARKPE
ncbi:MAG TPA: class I SAM-dependent methyltransferase [Gaiellaceae bacterium]